MSIAIPSVGTPAQRYSTNWSPSYSQKLAWRLKKFAGWVAEVTFGCRHRNITIPINDHQTCLDCGATRLYLYTTEMFFQGITDAPVFIGRWKKASLEIHPEIAKDLIAASAAPVSQAAPVNFPRSLAHCLDCGEELDSFGICPQAATRDIVLTSSPVHCGKAARA